MGPGSPARRGGTERAALELLVHGVGGATPQRMLDDPRTVRVSGDGTAALFRRRADADAESDPERRRPVPEAYVWCNLTSGDAGRALWLLLLPFMVVNLAHWMRPPATGGERAARLYGLLLRLLGLTLTVLFVATACEVALDLGAWQCAGSPTCATRLPVTDSSSLAGRDAGWWGVPGRRLAAAALVPAGLTALLWYLSLRTWRDYEAQEPLDRPSKEPGDSGFTALGRPGFWYGRRLVARLRSAHTAAGLFTVAAAVGAPAAAFDRARTGSALLDVLGWVLMAALAGGFVVVTYVVCRRGRSEIRLDRALDGHLVRRLPTAALSLLVLALVYACWARPGWESVGRLPGGPVFGGIALAQGLLICSLVGVTAALRRSGDDPRAALRGFGGPAVAVLACALGAVMSAGLVQRVSDWLDGAEAPALTTWQTSAIPPLLTLVPGLCGALALGAWARARSGFPGAAPRSADGGPVTGARGPDTARARRVATIRAMATLTDRASLVVAVTAVAAFLCGACALACALATDRAPADAANSAPDLVRGAVRTSQALGSWLVGLGLAAFLAWGRRAYRDTGARRTVGILWDVGTFWPRATHPFAPPCYAERAVPDLTWRIVTWTRATGGNLVLSGHSQGSVLAAAAAWQLDPVTRGRVGLLTYGSPLERLYGRWFPAHFGPAALRSLRTQVACWRNLHRLTDPIGGPVGLVEVDREPLADPLSFRRTDRHPLPSPVLGHSDYQADPVFAEERREILRRLATEVPGPREAEPTGGARAVRGEPADPPRAEG